MNHCTPQLEHETPSKQLLNPIAWRESAAIICTSLTVAGAMLTSTLLLAAWRAMTSARAAEVMGLAALPRPCAARARNDRVVRVYEHCWFAWQTVCVRAVHALRSLLTLDHSTGEARPRGCCHAWARHKCTVTLAAMALQQMREATPRFAASLKQSHEFSCCAMLLMQSL
jgi:hypothetical protein